LEGSKKDGEIEGKHLPKLKRKEAWGSIRGRARKIKLGGTTRGRRGYNLRAQET